MGNAYPAARNGKPCSASLAIHNGNDVSWSDGAATDLAALVEENARLRALVVKLSDIVLRNVAEHR